MNELWALPFGLKRLQLILLLVSQTAQACPQCDRLARVPQIGTSGSLSRTLGSTPLSRRQGRAPTSLYVSIPSSTHSKWGPRQVACPLCALGGAKGWCVSTWHHHQPPSRPIPASNMGKSPWSCCWFFCLCGCTMWHAGSWFLDQGSNPCSLQRQHGVLTTRPPGKSLALLSVWVLRVPSKTQVPVAPRCK